MIKIIFEDNSFILFRISETELKSRICVDSDNEVRLRVLLKEGLSIINNI